MPGICGGATRPPGVNTRRQVNFLVDAQLPPALAHWLREAGYNAVAVREVGLHTANDSAIWQHAQKAGLIIITKDEDFAQRAQSTASGPVIVWLRIGNSSNANLRTWLLPRMTELVGIIDQGHRVIEVR